MNLPKPKYPKDVKVAIAAHKKATAAEAKAWAKIETKRQAANNQYNKACALVNKISDEVTRTVMLADAARTKRITALCALCNGHGINPAPIIIELNKRPEPKTISHDNPAL
jgi:hypothetical protein